MKIIGISCFYHDSAACLLNNGEIISAVQEERFTRVKHDSSFPTNSIKYILNFSKISAKDVDHIIFYEKPFVKFERLLETTLANIPFGFKIFKRAIPIWLKEKLFQKKLITEELLKIDSDFKNNKILFSDHHLSHAASSYYTSNFNEAMILTVDGVGEKNTTTIVRGENNKLTKVEEINFPHSIGLLYSAFTYYLGFKVNSGEYKVMGLAPYGKPIYKDIILKHFIDLKEDGSFKLNLKYFSFTKDLKMTNDEFNKVFEKKNRDPKDKIEEFHMNLASSIQYVLEEILLKICIYIKKKYKNKNFCIAGGVALNCVANARILKEKIFENIWVQPAAGDAGGALGCALFLWHHELNKERLYSENLIKGSLLGPSYLNQDIKEQLIKLNANYELKNPNQIIEIASKELEKGKIIGWFQNRMEFGPRALGSRSIIADPRNPEMQKNLNLKIKYREGFRPFAPSVLKEYSKDWFEIKIDSPYMLFTSKVAKEKLLSNDTDDEFELSKINNRRSVIPAVTHLDNSARLQTVDKKHNPKYYQLISNFYKNTGCPLVINTSFNVRGEPIVLSPEDAYNCFMGTEIDILIIEDFILYKHNQINKIDKNFIKKFDED